MPNEDIMIYFEFFSYLYYLYYLTKNNPREQEGILKNLVRIRYSTEGLKTRKIVFYLTH